MFLHEILRVKQSKMVCDLIDIAAVCVFVCGWVGVCVWERWWRRQGFYTLQPQLPANSWLLHSNQQTINTPHPTDRELLLSLSFILLLFVFTKFTLHILSQIFSKSDIYLHRIQLFPDYEHIWLSCLSLRPLRVSLS